MDNGIADPMSLPTMHAILDVAEAMAVEQTAHAEKKPENAKAAVARLFDRLYRPDVPEVKKINGDGYRPPPPGFSAEEQDASFEAFAAVAQ